MKIEILGAESLGVRGLCCFLSVAKQRILIDPGIALGYFRKGQAPHPAQVAVGEVIKEKIIQAWEVPRTLSSATFMAIMSLWRMQTPINWTSSGWQT